MCIRLGTAKAKESHLVRYDSRQSVADLKGHKVAFQKGSSSHNLLIRALQQAGLKLSDIRPVYLTPADARAAFQQHDVDAWAIWDPYYSAAQVQGNVRVLTDGSSLHQTGSFYLAPKKYTEANPQFIQQVLTVLTQANALTKTDRDRASAAFPSWACRKSGGVFGSSAGFAHHGRHAERKSASSNRRSVLRKPYFAKAGRTQRPHLETDSTSGLNIRLFNRHPRAETNERGVTL